ncbi:YrvL family regulatory protein [Gracilibacillus salinarum]|uniref:Regulatory YrvL family protein n=1 Tax=Gracilibacillus salinarum TaxID=2932255 RepID=A0ABY4GIE2_9BACI|nr:YrvL family regulatory protein [Gracilibacillus salinarum]UOQ83537.1 regulatory YrvL family protein [Gracilibacillus salinarum]
MNEKTKNIIGITIFSICIMGILMGVYFLVITGLFEIFNVQYSSIWSLLLFVISICILGLPVDLIFGAMADISVEKMRGKVPAFVIQFIFGFVTNLLVISIVDAFMSGINLSPGAKFVIIIILTLIESVFEDGKNKDKEAAA